MQKKGSGLRLSPVALCLLFAAVVATPVFFLLGFIYNRLSMANWQFRLNNGLYDFWLTPEQSMAYLKKTNRYNEVRKLLSSAEGDAKSATYDEYQPVLNSLAKDLERLQSLPMENWKKFRDIVARTNAFLLCLVTWCAVVLYFHWPVDDQTIGTIIDQYTRLALYLPELVSAGGDPQPLGHDLLWAVANAAFWPILLYFPIKQLAGLLAYFYSKRPVDVNFGSVTASLDRCEAKTVFVASAARSVEPIIEIVDDPGSLEPENNRCHNNQSRTRISPVLLFTRIPARSGMIRRSASTDPINGTPHSLATCTKW